MNVLLLCVELLGLFLTAALSQQHPTSSNSSNGTYVTPIDVIPGAPTSEPSATGWTVQRSTSLPTPTQAATSPPVFFPWWKQCRLLTLVCCGLIVACAVFLMLTLVLLVKVCQMSRRLRRLGAGGDLISVKEYNMAERSKGDSADVLMADASPTSQEMANGTAKEDGGKASEDGQVKEEEGDVGATPGPGAAESTPLTEAPGAAATTDTAVASTAEGGAAEEPKDVV